MSDEMLDGLVIGSVEDKARKRAKVVRLVNRARACRSFEGLEVIGNEMREQGLWDAEDGWIPAEMSKCNARLRGRHTPALFVKGSMKVTVFDNGVIAREPASLQIYSPKEASRHGFLYSPIKDVKE